MKNKIFREWEEKWIKHEAELWGYRHSYLMYQLEFIEELIHQECSKKVKRLLRKIDKEIDKRIELNNPKKVLDRQKIMAYRECKDLIKKAFEGAIDG